MRAAIVTCLLAVVLASVALVGGASTAADAGTTNASSPDVAAGNDTPIPLFGGVEFKPDYPGGPEIVYSDHGCKPTSGCKRAPVLVSDDGEFHFQEDVHMEEDTTLFMENGSTLRVREQADVLIPAETDRLFTGGTATIGTADENTLRLVVDNKTGLRLVPAATPNVVGGNASNSLGQDVTGAAIGGGGSGSAPNEVLADFGTVSGGRGNVASGLLATAIGGEDNQARGEASLAAGRAANASHAGSFVWSDSDAAGLVSTGPDQFLVDAAGGVGVGTDTPASALTVEGDVTPATNATHALGSPSLRWTDVWLSSVIHHNGTLEFENDAGAITGSLSETGDFTLPGTLSADTLKGDGSGLTGVEADEIANDSVTTTAIADSEVQTVDLANDSVTGAKVNASQIQVRVSDSCGSEASIDAINQDGTVTCESDDDTQYDGSDFAVSDQSCATGDVAAGVDASGNLVCEADDDTTYSGGTGITVTSSDTIENDLGTSIESGEITDATIKRADLAQDGCSDAQVIQWDGGTGSWVCSDTSSGDITAVDAASGLDGGGTSGDVSVSVNTSETQVRVTDACGSEASIDSINEDGTVTCETDDDTTYTASSPVDLSGTDFTLSSADCSSGDHWVWNGSAWNCIASGDITAVSAGTGLSGGATSGDASLAVDTSAIQERVSDSCGTNASIEAINQDGTVSCEADDDTTYSGGTGITVSGTTIDNDLGSSIESGEISDGTVDTADLAGDAVTSSEIANATIERVDLAQDGCADTEILKYDTGTGSWTCAADEDSGGDITSVSAGSGLDGGGTSGDVSVSVNTSETQVRVSGSCGSEASIDAVNEDGTVSCEADDDTTYTGGTGITVTSSDTIENDLGTSIESGEISDGAVGAADVDSSAVQERVSGTCGSDAAIDAINEDGTVSCETENTVDAWLLGGNSGTTAGTDFLGTTDSETLVVKVNDTQIYALEPAAGDTPNVVGGNASNTVKAGARGVTIAGGGTGDILFAGSRFGPMPNNATDIFATVSGGADNTAGDGDSDPENGRFATVGGGNSNTASDQQATVSGGGSNTASALGATVGGGGSNTASGTDATVAGGDSNTASGIEATVGGGDSNAAQGRAATVPGGTNNIADGDDSFAAGAGANASHDGAFVWSDSTSTSEDSFGSTGPDQFLIDAAGGVGIGVTNPTDALEVAGTVDASDAQLGIGSIEDHEIQDGEVRSAEVADGSLTGTDVSDGSLGGADVSDGSLAAADVDSTSIQERVSGSCGADEAIDAINQDGTVSCETEDASNAWLLGGNSGTTAGTDFVGTTDLTDLVVKVNGTQAYAFEPTDGDVPNIVGGDANNTVSSGVNGGTISGGGTDALATGEGTETHLNTVTDRFGTVGGGGGNTAGTDNGDVDDADFATVGGGKDNLAGEYGTTVAGGDANTASGSTATVGGGNLNTASGIGATIGGGYSNDATNSDATVGGGSFNNASGLKATVPGGNSNLAGGDYSLAAGAGANASHDGTFVWSDSTSTSVDSFGSTGADQFLVDAAGGVGINTGSPTQDLTVANHVSIGSASSSDDDVLYWDAGAESIEWADSADRFELSDHLAMPQSIKVGTTGHGQKSFNQFCAESCSSSSGTLDTSGDVLTEFALEVGSGVYTDTILAQDGASGSTIEMDGHVGIGTSSAGNDLTVANNTGGANWIPSDNPVLIENTQSSNNGRALALQLGQSTPGGGDEWVTFFDGDDNAIGSIEGDGNDGVSYTSGSADFAEYFPKENPAAPIEAGDVVGLHDGEVRLETKGADAVFAVSTAPAFLGNKPEGQEGAGVAGTGAGDSQAPLAMMGQVPVEVTGPVSAGDKLVPSGAGDGRAVSAADGGQSGPPVGVALESYNGTGPGEVKTLVGVGSSGQSSEEDSSGDLKDRVQQLEQENEQLEEEVQNLSKRVDRLESMVEEMAGEQPATG